MGFFLILKFDVIIYISNFERIVSSLIELVGKTVIAYTLVSCMGYLGVIIAEPIVWSVMVIPLIV